MDASSPSAIALKNVARRLGTPAAIGLADRMWALMVLRFAAALPGARQELASKALSPLRSRKSPAEVAALREAGQAIDRVHASVPGWLRYSAVVAGFAVFMLSRKSIFAGVICGEIVMLSGKWWLG